MITSRKQPTIANNDIYINDAIRFNAFALPHQQADKVLVLQFLILILNFIAIIFESFLHVNLGRDYVNPLGLFFGFIKHCMTSLQDALSLLVIVLAVVGLFAYFGGYTASFNTIWGELYDFFRSPFVRTFFVVGFAVMTIQAVYSFLTYRKTKRFSYSNGTPWLYYLTRQPFFKSSPYVLFVEPVFVILLGLGLHSSSVGDAKYLALFGLLYLIRNLYVYSIMDKGMVERNNMEVQSVAENISQQEQSKPQQKTRVSPTPMRSETRHRPADELEDFID